MKRKRLWRRFKYRAQDEPGRIAQALGLAEQFGGEDQVVVILGDNIFKDSIRTMASKFRSQCEGAKIILKEVHAPQRYGAAEIKDGIVLGIEEKPKEPKTNYAVAEIYLGQD